MMWKLTTVFGMPTDAAPFVPYLFYRILWRCYAPEFYWWECYEIYRRVLFNSVIPVISDVSTKRAACGVFLALLSSVVYRELSPYRHWHTNMLAQVSCYTIMLTYGAALALKSDMREGISDSLFGWVILLVNVVLIGLVMALASYRHWVQTKRLYQWQHVLDDREYRIVRSILEAGKPNDMLARSQAAPMSEAGLELGMQNQHKEIDGTVEASKPDSHAALERLSLPPTSVECQERVGTGSFGEVRQASIFGIRVIF